MKYRIKGWKKFQHFKDRRPPWIKLHRDILDDFAINQLSGDAFKFLVQLWLIASEDPQVTGTLPACEEIAYRLRLNKTKCFDLLKQVDIFLISEQHHDDITLISSQYQNYLSEIETEKEYSPIQEWFEEAWDGYPNKVGRKEAERHYKASVKNEKDRDDCLRARENYKTHLKIESWKKPQNGSTWFNNWRDWVDWKELVASNRPTGVCL